MPVKPSSSLSSSLDWTMPMFSCTVCPSASSADFSASRTQPRASSLGPLVEITSHQFLCLYTGYQWRTGQNSRSFCTPTKLFTVCHHHILQRWWQSISQLEPSGHQAEVYLKCQRPGQHMAEGPSGMQRLISGMNFLRVSEMQKVTVYKKRLKTHLFRIAHGL